jgi:hypothetical protein
MPLRADLLFCWFVGLGIDDGIWEYACVSVSRTLLVRLQSQQAGRTLLEDRLREPQQTLRIMTEQRQRMRTGEVQRKMRARRT